MNRGRLMLAVACMAALASFAAAAADEAWRPTRGVEVVVGVSPGGSMDRTAREVLKGLTAANAIPSSSIVNNRPGGGHAVAMAYLRSHQGDGNYIEVVNTPLITNYLLGRSPMKYTDFTPLAVLFVEKMMFAVPADSPVKDARDLVARLKKDPSSLSIAVSSGVGTANDIAALELAKAIGIDAKKLKTVSFNSAAENVEMALGGHVDVTITTPFSILPFIQSHKLRGLAVAGDTRLPAPNQSIPTWKELGYDVNVTAWRAVIGPPNLPPDQIAFWEAALKHLTDSPDWKTQLNQEMLTPSFMNAQQTTAFLQKEDTLDESLYKDVGVAVTK